MALISSVGTSAEARLCPVIKSMIYVVINTQIRYMIVFTRLRVRVSYIMLILMRKGSGPRKFPSAKKIREVLNARALVIFGYAY